jgi:hypothetical protein
MKRSIHQVGSSSGRGSITQYGRMLPRRPFKKVRVQGNSLVPYGRTNYYVQRPIGALGISKGVDTNVSQSDLFTTMANNDHVYPLNLVQAGTGSWNRVGRILTMTSLRCRMELTQVWLASTLHTRSRMLRYVIVYDRQPNGTLPIKTDMFQYKSQAGVETGNWNGFLSYDNMQRFQILKDDTLVFEPPPRTFDSAGAPKNTIMVDKHIDFYLPLSHITNYKAESSPATIADISTGALYCVFLTDTVASDVTNEGSFSVQTALFRLRYKDKQ